MKIGEKTGEKTVKKDKSYMIILQKESGILV